MKKDILNVIIVVVLLAILGAFFVFAPDAELDFGPVEIEYGSVEVPDQYILEQVDLKLESSEPGFVTIHESMDIAPGETIGVSDYFEPGVHYPTIALTKAMSPGSTYIAILHVDDGDQEFNLDDDGAAMVDGEVVRPSFEAFLLDDSQDE